MRRSIKTEETADDLRGLFFCARNILMREGRVKSLWQMLRKTAPPLLHKKSEIKRVIREAGSEMPTKSNNTGGRGGKRPGAGRKKSAIKEKYENGNPGGRPLEVLDIPEMEGVEMPKPHDFLSAEQRDGSELQAKEIYEETWKRLKKIGCSQKVSSQLLE